MGLSSTTNRVSYAGDGSSTIFSFPYYFFAPADLNVYLYDINSSIVYAQALNTNYTVSGNVNLQGVYPGGGNVVMNSSFPSNLQIIVTRAPSPVQNYVLNQNAQINSVALVQQFDYLTGLVQRLQDEVGRAVQLPDGVGTIGGTTFNPNLPQTTPLPSMGGAPLVLNSGATGWTYGVVATGSGTVAYLGILPVLNGGTGASSLTAHSVLIGEGTSAVVALAAGASGTVLQSNGSGADPSWGTVTVSGSSVSGVLAPQFGGTGANGLGLHGVLIGEGSSAVTSLVSGSSGQFLQSNGLSLDPSWANTLGVANGGTGSGSSLVNSRLIQSVGGTFGESALVINGSNAVSHGFGALQNPGVNFLGATHSGIYFVGSSSQPYTALVCSSLEAVNSMAIGGGLVNIGIGLSANPGSSNPFQTNRTLNATVIYSYQNQSNGNVSATVLQVANGTGTNNTTVENWANLLGTSYLAGGSAFLGSPNQTMVAIGSEAAAGFVGFVVGGRTLVQERMRLTTTGLTHNAGVGLIFNGSTGSVTIRAASSITSYNMVWPTALGAANTFLQTDVNGQLTWAPTAGAALSLSTKSANYVATTTDDIVIAASGVTQVTTFGATGNSGKVLRIKNTSLGSVLITGSAATIDGTSVILAQQYAGAELMCDGANWSVNKFIPRGSTRTILSSSGTYTMPFGCTSLWIRAVGGGGGGGGSTTAALNNGSSGLTGGLTIFGSSTLAVLFAGGGVGGGGQVDTSGGLGGSSAIGVLSFGVALKGTAGGSGSNDVSVAARSAGGAGAGSVFGGGGAAGASAFNGLAGANGTGGGGGGAGGPNAGYSGGGGGSGGYVDVVINLTSALPNSFTYNVGDGGGFGGAGTGGSGSSGAAGGTGTIVVEERYS